MRYSLLSRFRGALLGAAIAASLGDRSLNAAVKSVQTQNIESQSGEPQAQKSWIYYPIASAESLIRCRDLDLSDWRDRIDDTGTGKPEIFLERGSCIAALAILPIILFYHENKRLLLEKIEEAASVWPELGEFTDGMLIWGYAISQLLQEKPGRVEEFPKSLIDIVLSGIGTKARKADGQIQALDKIEKLCQQGVSLKTAVNELTAGSSGYMTSIALAFYCFLSTREDFRLSVLRAARTDKDTLLTCILTGALSGAYNSTAGISLSWQMSRYASVQEPVQEMVKLGDRLFAAWSGAYDLENIPLAIDKVAVAVPNAIRPLEGTQGSGGEAA
ncbi:MAG: ADP-ribosylglycohydrolase family protein [Oscillatoria sp. SIO1A7]|nr:ADP-ribosylglycohydrolase family protein [Oscillatoria sp. SIO1A7]